MKITIQQAQEDGYGNVKENIFLAFDENQQYLGNGFVYPTINEHQTNETPYLIFVSLNVEDQPQAEKIRKLLFDAMMKRADELRSKRPQMACRIYAGFEWNETMMNFYKQNGFEEDYSVFMEADLTDNQICELPKNYRVEEFSVQLQEQFEAFKCVYDEYFVTPLDEGYVEAQKQDSSFKNYKFFIEEELVGEYSVRTENGCGWIETLFVLENQRGRGIAKYMMQNIHDSFRSKGLRKAKLEVWELNRRAVNLYRSCGYKEVQKNNMFPGKTV